MIETGMHQPKLRQIGQNEAVIITGESAQNARMVLELLSVLPVILSYRRPGESGIRDCRAGKRSLREFSEENGTVVVNLDIGGGTMNVLV